MLVKVGNYTHDDAECGIKIARRFDISESGIKLAMIETWTISGILQAASQSAITSKLKSMEETYNGDGMNVGVYTSGGILTRHFIQATAAQYVRGLGVQYPIGDGPEYTTYRHYEASVEARFLLSGVSSPGSIDDLVSYEESIEISGDGSSRRALAEVIAGPWQEQTLNTHTPVTIVQSGSAVGGSGYPRNPAPLFPDRILDPRTDRKIKRGSPKTLFPVQRDFPLSWNFIMTFAQNAPSDAAPTIPS